MNDKKNYINNNRQKKKKLAPNGLFPRENKRICLLGTPKRGLGEKSKEPERKETVTTSKRKGHNKKQTNKQKSQKTKIIRVG